MFDNLKDYVGTAGWGRVAGEVLIIYVVLLLIFRLVHGTRGAGVLRGLVFLLVTAFVGMLFVVKHLRLYAIVRDDARPLKELLAPILFKQAPM